jgi:hypothetical protein
MAWIQCSSLRRHKREKRVVHRGIPEVPNTKEQKQTHLVQLQARIVFQSFRKRPTFDERTSRLEGIICQASDRQCVSMMYPKTGMQREMTVRKSVNKSRRKVVCPVDKIES